ncbi:MAG TPA: hypothetical protein VKS78_13130 [Roseiarcus sp.]|nr:hypothetical protein [Roseiarcus sp.]
MPGKADARWRIRSVDDLNRELSACYGLPIDIANKASALAGVARALDRGDLALAQIASVLMRFPDPPSPKKLVGPEPVERIKKFGRDAIEDPSNIVWIPRLTHEQITAEGNSVDRNDSSGRLRRQVVNEMSFDEQRAEGLRLLRKYGALK